MSLTLNLEDILMLTGKHIAVTAVGLLTLIGSARADWNVSEPYKYVQLPDRQGWDVSPHDPQDGTFTALADDWVCAQTGPVSDIHIWYSWKNDLKLSFDFEVGIYSDVPAGLEPGSYSHPGEMLWSGLFFENQYPKFWSQVYTNGNQGWYVPGGNWAQNDHTNMYQLNVTNIANPFVQQAGMTYWLVVEMTGLDSDRIGWKTSLTQSGDSAVWLNTSNRANMVWEKLLEPGTQAPLDLAFVITTIPEPATPLLLGLGAVALIVRRRRMFHN
jgi:hypothetical protein